VSYLAICVYCWYRYMGAVIVLVTGSPWLWLLSRGTFSILLFFSEYVSYVLRDVLLGSPKSLKLGNVD